MEPIVVLLIAVLALAIGMAAGYFFSRMQYERLQRRNQETADKIISQANERARTETKYDAQGRVQETWDNIRVVVSAQGTPQKPPSFLACRLSR